MTEAMMIQAAAHARTMAAVARVMGRYDVAARLEAEAHALDVARGAPNAEAVALALAAHQQNETFQYN